MTRRSDPFGMYRIVLSRPYIVGVMTNSTSRTSDPTAMDARAAVAVPLRHTSPRMNGTTRQASSRSKARVEQDARLLDVDRDQDREQRHRHHRDARRTQQRIPLTGHVHAPNAAQVADRNVGDGQDRAVGGAHRRADESAQHHDRQEQRARTGRAARTGSGRRVPRAGTPAPTARRGRTVRRSRPRRSAAPKQALRAVSGDFAANTRCMKSIATMSPMPSAISVAQLMVAPCAGSVIWPEGERSRALGDRRCRARSPSRSAARPRRRGPAPSG